MATLRRHNQNQYFNNQRIDVAANINQDYQIQCHLIIDHRQINVVVLIVVRKKKMN